MTFAREAGAALVLVTFTLSLQCAGMAALIAWARTSLAPDVHKQGPFRSAVLMVRFITAFIFLHIFEILLWAGFYRWRSFPLWESTFYFSTSSYATVGYGDIVLPQSWRTLGPVESIIGVLMCGLSARFLFAIVTLRTRGAAFGRIREIPGIWVKRRLISVKQLCYTLSCESLKTYGLAGPMAKLLRHC